MTALTHGALADDDGPTRAFLVAASALGIVLDVDDVIERLDAHPAQGSLKALVDVAREVGVTARAFRSDLPGLDAVALPAIVHLQREHEVYGFGVLVGRGEKGLVLDDGHGPRTVDPQAFLRHWTGILVTLEASGGAAPGAPRAGLAWRLRRALRGRGTAPRHQVAARGLAGTAVAALAAWAVATPGRTGVWAAAAGLTLFAACAAGAVAAWALFHKGRVTSIPGATPRLASVICGRGTVTDCSGVLTSRYARLLGIDLSSLGLSLFGSVFALCAVGALTAPAPRIAMFTELALFFAACAPFSLIFIAVQFWPLRRICPLCMTVHAVVLCCAAAGLYGHAGVLAGGPAVLASVAAAVAPWAALHALLFAAMLGLVASWFDLSIESRATRARLSWIGATPWGALAELVGRPRATRRRLEAAVTLGDAAAPFRLDAMVHPMCTGCGPVVDELQEIVREHGALVSVGLHLPPRDTLLRSDRETCAAIVAVGLAHGADTALEVFRAAKRRTGPALAAAEAGGAEGVLRLLAPERADEACPHLPAARAAVSEAEALADELQRGTPTLLVAGRPWESPASDLRALLRAEPAVLARLLRVRLPAALAEGPNR